MVYLSSYCEDIIKLESGHSKLFYIRANKCESLYERILGITQWEEVEINYIRYQVFSLPFTQFLADRNYRLVVMREKREDAQLNLFQGAFKYRCILTNDHQSTEKDVIEYYNQRGTSEKLFDVQNNDFGWKHLPFSDMAANTVCLILTAIIKKFYNRIVRQVSGVFDDITPIARLKRFVFLFVSVAGKWVRHARRWVLKLYTDRP